MTVVVGIDKHVICNTSVARSIITNYHVVRQAAAAAPGTAITRLYV